MNCLYDLTVTIEVILFFHSKRFSLKHVLADGKALVVPVIYLSHQKLQTMNE